MPVDITTYRARIAFFITNLPKAHHKVSVGNGLGLKYYNFFMSNSPHNKIGMVLFVLILVTFYLFNLSRVCIFTKRVKPSSCFLCMFTAYACYLKFKLLLAGDVHVNPGPPISHKLAGKLSFAHWNLNSLLTRNKSKINLIEAMQSNYNFDLFAISESFLNPNTKNEDLLIHGFSTVPLRSDCAKANTHPQGGVCLYFKEHVPLKHRIDLQLIDECIVCEIKLDTNKKLFFVLVYRSPSQTPLETNQYFSSLETIICQIKKENPALIILTGDINARSPLIWSGESTENLAGEKLAELITLESLSQIIEEPTHFANENSQTCIDLIITSNPSSIIDHGVLPSLDDKCKHQIIHAQINFRIPAPPKYKRVVWDYKACNVDALKYAISNFDWSQSFRLLNVHEMVDFFSEQILVFAKNYIPSKQVTISDSDAPWITNKIKFAIKNNKNIYKNWLKNGQVPADRVVVNRSQRKTNKLIREAKSYYIKTLSNKISDPQCGAKIFWSSYKRLLNNKKITNIPPLLYNGSFISKFKEKAAIFNNYFSKQCQIIDNDSVLPENLTPFLAHRISSLPIRECDIANIISKLNPKKAHGVDGISAELLKMCSNEVSVPLRLIFEKALSSGQYPNLWKRANVQPVHKKNSRQLVSNYRPISLLCICGKIFEKMIFDKMYAFFNDNELISHNQSGFRPGDSTINQLLAITNEIYEAFENFEEVRAVFLDISKAFDKTWHEGLIFKLKQFGVDGDLINLLSDYLSNRFQRVVLNGQESGWDKINAGVPQGSVLGPLLFLVYINDLADGVSSNIKLFADDSSLFARVKNNVNITHARLTDDLQTITSWAHSWKMKFNPDITKQAIEVIFSHKNSKPFHPPLVFNNIPVDRRSSTKHLGVILDERLSFSEHVKEAIEKAKKGIALMKFLSNKVSSAVLELTYKMYVRPHLDYGDVIYHDQHSKSMELLEKVQYQAGLIVSRCWRGTSKRKLYGELGWELLSERRISRRLALYYKINNNLAPSYLQTYIKVYSPRTNRFKNSFFPFCAARWEPLPDNIKSAHNLAHFKKLYSFENMPIKKSFFGISDRYGTSILMKLRVDFSDLRDHRFNHGFRNCPSASCRCVREDETTEHYFARCHLFLIPREHLVGSISNILNNDISILPHDHFTNLLLYGSTAYNGITNKLILEATIRYIKSTQRFIKLEAFSI